MLEKVVDTFDSLDDRLRIVCQSSPQGAEIGFRFNLHVLGAIQGQDRTADVRKEGTYVKGQKIFQIRSPNLSDYSLKSLLQRHGKSCFSGGRHWQISDAGIKDITQGIAVSIHHFGRRIHGLKPDAVLPD